MSHQKPVDSAFRRQFILGAREENITDEFQWVRAAESAIKHHGSTGLHITLDEVKGWVQAIKKDRGTQLPKCHI